MLFNSFPFLVFFAIVYPTYLLLPLRWQNRLLIVAGYVFYGWWDIRFLFLLALSTGVDYCCGLMLGTGTVPAKDRATVSAFLLAAAVAFTVPDWSAVSLSSPEPGGATLASMGITVDWGRLVPPEPAAWYITLATVGAVLLANVAYTALVALPEERRGQVIVLTVFLNLAFLGFFKYFNFFIDTAEHLLWSLGLPAERFYLHIVLPVGISFYTFQSMSYTIDVYRRKFAPVRRFWDYATFVSFFPPLVAGPIERGANFIPQLVRPRHRSLARSADGLALILFGFFKKIAIADGLAGSVSSVFGSSGNPGCGDIWAATLCFTLQIYCDFSGYTDIARGIAKLLGMELMLNFNLPYVSKSPSEFWTRWHISLSSWLRDYLYIPLGGNRKGSVKTYRNLMITMLLGGLWHGAAWNFVLWGIYHGLILCGYRAVDARREVAESGQKPPAPTHSRSRLLPGLAAWAFFFLLTCYGWMLFRAGSLHQVVAFTRSMFTGAGGFELKMTWPRLSAIVGVPMLIGYELIEYVTGSSGFLKSLPTPARGAWYAALGYAILMGMSNEPAQFIYFQF